MPRLEELPPEAVADAVAKAVVEAVGQGGDTETIVARALAGAKQRLEGAAPNPTPTAGYVPPAPSANGRHAPAALGSGKLAGGVHGGGRPVLTEGDVLDAVRGGRTELGVAPGTIVTALARDAARDAGLRLVEG